MINFILSFLFGILVFYVVHHLRTQGFKKLGREILEEAEKKIDKAKELADLTLLQNEIDHKKHLEKLTEIQTNKFQKEKEKLEKKEELLDQRSLFIEKEIGKIEELKKNLQKEKTAIDAWNHDLIEKEKFFRSEIERVSQMTNEDAKKLLFDTAKNEIDEDLTKLEYKLKREMEDEAQNKAKKILLNSMERLTLSCISESTLSCVSLPNEEMKKRIIGREGRNIRALEHATGVNFLVDDTPGSIVISAFDPIRKEIAKLTLKELIKDGRIHPLRIVEVVEEVKVRLDNELMSKGAKAAASANVHHLHPHLLMNLGKLDLRSNLGQNILDHSLEVSFLMGALAEELGLDSSLAKRIGLLHDIGKIASQEVEGSHATIGHDLVLKFGENQIVANGIGAHHHEMTPTSFEAWLCPIANKISSERLGARIEALDQHIKRARKLETLSSQFDGVEKVYALQTGKEIRVLVEAEKFDDASTAHLAKKIARKIESELSYPGKIKVTVIRETKAIEYAS